MGYFLDFQVFQDLDNLNENIPPVLLTKFPLIEKPIKQLPSLAITKLLGNLLQNNIIMVLIFKSLVNLDNVRMIKFFKNRDLVQKALRVLH